MCVSFVIIQPHATLVEDDTFFHSLNEILPFLQKNTHEFAQ
jgi:hypothetical protein